MPNGTKTVTIKCENLTKVNSSLNTSYVNIYVLNTVSVTVTMNGNQTNYVKQYNSHILVQKNNQPSKSNQSIIRNFKFNTTNIKGILITNVNAKGTIQILTA